MFKKGYFGQVYFSKLAKNQWNSDINDWLKLKFNAICARHAISTSFLKKLKEYGNYSRQCSFNEEINSKQIDLNIQR